MAMSHAINVLHNRSSLLTAVTLSRLIIHPLIFRASFNGHFISGKLCILPKIQQAVLNLDTDKIWKKGGAKCQHKLIE